MMKTPIRILHVVTIMNTGGTEAMLMNYYRNIDTSRVQFDFLVHRAHKGFHDDEILHLGGKIHHLPPLTLRSAWKYRKLIIEFLKKHPEYECIHIHSSGVAYFVAKAAHKLGKRVIIQHSHCGAPDKMDLTTPIRFFCKVCTRKFLTHFFACGKEAAEWLFGKKLARLSVFIPNAIDANQFRHSELVRNKIREEYNLSDKVVIGCVARFDHQKNHVQLLHIFKELVSTKPDAMLMLVGAKRGLYNNLKNLVKQLRLEDKVIFTGARGDIYNIMQAFDVFVFPSLYEGFGIVLLEAQAAGLPCVKSNMVPEDAVAIPELVRTCNLSADNQTWLHAINQALSIQKRDTYADICKAGFDIKSNSSNLQNFYLKNLTDLSDSNESTTNKVN